MKRYHGLIPLLAVLLLMQGCNDEYLQKIDELEGRVAALKQTCDKLNGNLASVRALYSVYEDYDMVTSITTFDDGSGYRLNFVNHAPVTITNGKDGLKPIVSSKWNSAEHAACWTVQYGEGAEEWLRDPDGNLMHVTGSIPYVTIRDNKFVLTWDNVNWVELGKADGQQGDSMFASIDSSNPNYVVITLSSGDRLKFPTYASYLALKEEIEKVNDDTRAQVELLEAFRGKLTWIESITPILSAGDTTGLTVTLSNGKSLNVRDWTTSLSPAIYVKKDTDGRLYWAYTIGLSPERWVLSPDGSKVPADSDPVEVPLVGIARDTVDSQFYWTVTAGDSTRFLRSLVDSVWTPKAVDSVSRVFLSVRDYPDSLVVVRKDSTKFVLPKQYSVSIFDSNGAAVADRLDMAPGQRATLRYRASGTGVSLTLLTQGGFSATRQTDSTFVIQAPGSFTSGQGRVVAVFSFQNGASPVTVVKTINIYKKEE